MELDSRNIRNIKQVNSQLSLPLLKQKLICTQTVVYDIIQVVTQNSRIFPVITMVKDATMKIHISANDIKQWGTNDARRAQEQLPLLIWKLILASCTIIRNHHFPFNEGIQYNGFDGYLDADSSSPFVPNGKSIWEFGTNQGCKQKFESDYAKRVKQIEPSEQSEYTFCFVTSQIWNARQSAAEVAVEKEKDSHWKNIRIYDAADI